MNPTPEQVRELVERLEAADRDSVQRMLGSRIFGDAASALTTLVDALEDSRKDQERYQHCQLWGFPVRNQTAHNPDHSWVTIVDKKAYYGCTPSFAIDAAIKAGGT